MSPQVTAGRLPVFLLTVGAIIGGLNYGSQKVRGIADDLEIMAAYKETQVWANEQTPETALFMVDPCRWYGWRDFSGRASLGTVREWYMTAWIYTDRGEFLEKGKDIARTLGFDMAPFRNKPRSSSSTCEAARSVYYDPSLRGQSRIAEEYDVDFFVFESEFAAAFLPDLQGRADFQNEHFLVVPAERLK